MSQAATQARIRGHLGVSVHGYNQTLAEAAFHLAQINVHLDSEEAVVPILFSWPSEDAVMGYVADRDGVTYARDELAPSYAFWPIFGPKGKSPSLATAWAVG